MSYFSQFVWRPVVATLARLAGSSHPPTAAAGQAALDAVSKLGQDVQAGLASGLTSNSAHATLDVAVKDLEDGLKAAVDAFLITKVPVLGGLAAEGANVALDWAESHAHDYVAGLFHHAKTNQQPVPT